MKTNTVSYFMLFLATVVMSTFAVADSPVTFGLVKHIDAGALTGFNDGDPVDVAVDLSGTQDMIQSNVDMQPLYIESGINGLPVLRFDGNDGLDALNGTNELFQGDQPHVAFFVATSERYHNPGTIWMLGRVSSGKCSYFGLETETKVGNRMQNGYNSFVVNTPTDPNIHLSTPYLFANGYPGGGYSNYYLEVNGINITGTPNNPNNKMSCDNSDIGLGHRVGNASSDHHVGDIAEFLLFNRDLNSYEMADLQLYLSAKYGLTTTYTDPGPYTVFMGPSGGNVDPGVTFTWSGNNGTGLTYELYIDTNANFSGITPVVTTETSYATVLSMNTTYYCRVDIQGGNPGTVQSFTTDGLTDTPAPGDGAIRIEANLAELTWRDVNVTGASYDVYFGKTDPLAFAETVTEATYVIDADLDPNAVYYWSVETVLGSDTVAGPVWNFTTGGKAVNPTPSVGDIGISTRPLLSWQGDRNDTYIEEYDVYIGLTDPPAYAATVTETSYTMDADIDPNDTYYWQVVAKRGGVQIVGGQPTWSFKTGLLVGHWPFDNNLTDIDSGNDASRADPQYASGFINDGSAADFAGDLGNDPITVPILNAVGNKANWTISFWEYSYAGGGGWETIIGNGADGNGWNTFEGGRYSSNRYVLGLVGSNYQYSPNDSSFLREGWHFHVVSNNRLRSTAHWYIDSRLIATYNGVNMTLAPDLYIGNVKGLSQPFNGKVDDLKLYSRPLTAGQVLQAYIDGVNGAPINPVPASGTGDIPWETTLQWTLVEVPIGITIEVGKEADLSDATPIVLAADATSFDTLTGLGVKLDPSTGYFWRVTATYSDKVSPSPIWFFTVRDFASDLSGNLVVGPEDASLMADEWLDDTYVTVPSGTEFNYINQEVWDDDPNLEDYDAYVTVGGPWGESILTVKTDPTPGTAEYTPPSQTLLWTAWAPGQQLCGLVFPDSIDFNKFDRFGFWAYGIDNDSNGQFRPIDLYGNQPFVKSFTTNGFNDEWHRYEWERGAQAVSNIRKVDIWMRDSTFSIEFGNWYVVKDGVEVAVCMGSNQIPEDLNGDCYVNLLDAAIMGADWALDASNP